MKAGSIDTEQNNTVSQSGMSSCALYDIISRKTINIAATMRLTTRYFLNSLNSSIRKMEKSEVRSSSCCFKIAASSAPTNSRIRSSVRRKGCIAVAARYQREDQLQVAPNLRNLHISSDGPARDHGVV